LAGYRRARLGRLASRYYRAVSWLYIALLALAVAVVAGAEWPRVAQRFGADTRRRRERAKRKSGFRVVRDEADDFAASVERDLANLPTIDETERR
jgi:hypothetical protein